MRNSDDTMGAVKLPNVPEIVPISEAITVIKDDGTKVSYFIFPEFEIHANTLVAHTVQGWHYHKHIEEIIFMTHGEIEVRWLDTHKKPTAKTLHEGDVCRLGRSIHTLANVSDQTANFVVYRLVPLEKNQHAFIKADRYPVEVEN